MSNEADPIRESIVLAGARMIVDRERVKPEMENAAERLAMFDELVEAVIALSVGLDAVIEKFIHPDQAAYKSGKEVTTDAHAIIRRAHALQGGGK